MRIRFQCSNETCRAVLRAEPQELADAAVTCPVCGREHVVNVGQAIAGDYLRCCPCCGGDELYLRKDFPQKLGLATVVIVAILSVYFFAMQDLGWAFGVLVALVIIDAIVHAVLPKITVCYRCKAEVRGVKPNPDHTGFDLATAEKYR